ncbi:TPA: holin, partial [Salmonella enterica subsp. enterica]|nr:holin [Salmonella enterica subsp. enterica]HAS1982255.1 holin [Salmonella enterica subsp. enterica]HAS2001280.1 holin [Salmonella enterica subsp. enterica]
IHPLALAGIGSALGILGLNGVEAWLRKKGIGFLGKGADK